MKCKYEINIIYRFICLLLLLLTILYINNVYILTLISFLVVYLNKKNYRILSYLIIFTFFFLLYKYLRNDFSFVNIVLDLDFIVLFIYNMEKDELINVKRFFINSKYEYKDLTKKYYTNFFNNNTEEFQKINNDKENFNRIKKGICDKTNHDVFDKLSVHYFRFYKNKNDIYNNFFMNKETIIYLSLHTICLIIVMVVKL